MTLASLITSNVSNIILAVGDDKDMIARNLFKKYNSIRETNTSLYKYNSLQEFTENLHFTEVYPNVPVEL